MEAIDEKLLAQIPIPQQVWIEMHDEGDACDAIVQTEDGTVYTALFATFSYLHRQMQLCYEVSKQMPDVPAVRYAPLDTPHILVEDLSREIIEDTIDNLLALDIFEGHFTRVTETEDDGTTRTNGDGKRATQEVAAVVISDVLVVEG